ncbi:MAG: hypothetical protein HGA75_19025, partial [Thiobacillus sp.]|nr:hypothetical protein [Thiobacillus sp.]
FLARRDRSRQAVGHGLDPIEFALQPGLFLGQLLALLDQLPAFTIERLQCFQYLQLFRHGHASLCDIDWAGHLKATGR